MKHKPLIIVVSLILIFAALELLLQKIDVRLSKDIKHYDKIPTIIRDFTEQRAGSGILFIGNSLTREGIDVAVLHEAFPRERIGVIRPDDTTISEWYWIFDSLPLEHLAGTHLVIPFALNQLSDKPLRQQNIISIANIVASGSLSRVNAFESLDLNDRTNLYLAHYSALFSLRERIQRRVLDLIPNYRIVSRQINQSLSKTAEHVETVKTYRHLTDLLHRAEHAGIRVSLLAMPLPGKHTLDPNLLDSVVIFENVDLIDARSVPGLILSDFRDGYHLNTAGANKLTKFISFHLQSLP